MSERNSAKRIADALRSFIQENPPETQLPSTRTLVQRYGASPVTISRTLTLLVREGLIYTRPGLGAFIAQRRVPQPKHDYGWQTVILGERPVAQETFNEVFQTTPLDVVPFGNGYIDQTLQPLSGLNAAMMRAVRRPATWDRLPPEGLPPLRSWFASEIGKEGRTQDVLIASGGQSALSTVFRALTRPGQTVLVETPTFMGALAAIRACGAVPVAVPSDSEGLRPDLLERALAATGASLIFVQPTYANPTGVSWSAERRRQIIQLAQDAGVLLVEDDAARDLHLEGLAPSPLVTLDPEHVIYVRSLTKSTAPGLRVAALICKGPVQERLRAARMTEDLFVSGPLQETALEWVISTARQKHLKLLSQTLKQRRDHLMKLLAGHPQLGTITSVPGGGFYVWLALPEQFHDIDLAVRARQAGVQVIPGRPMFPAEAPGSFLRLSFAATPPDVLSVGIERLLLALQRQMNT